MRQLTSKEAIALSESGWWKNMPAKDVVKFQFQQDCLCLPFDEFHRLAEEALGRPVFTHEFAFCRSHLIQELNGEIPKATLDTIFGFIADKIGEENVIVVQVDPEVTP